MLSTYRFRPRLIPSLIALALLPVLLGLGLWQLQRASDKRALRDQLASQSKEEAPRVLNAPLPDPGSLYRSRVVLQGRYDTARQYLLANRVRNGRSGYLVLTPLRLEGSDAALLVARDWVGATGERSNTPELPPAPSGRQRVTGIATNGPSVGLRVGAAYAGDGGWPRQIIYVDFEAMNDALPYRLTPVVIRADLTRDELAQQLMGRMTPRRHLGYAFQWFALALALVVIYIVANLRREAGHER